MRTTSSSRERRRAWAVFGTAMTTAVCGAVWMASAWEDVSRSNGVSVHRETRSDEEIREDLKDFRPQDVEPEEMPGWNPCEHFPFLLSTDCW
ncbi:hypothetical protein [Streptomyces curacoi]|uniref:Uncharacterized protein n=1 Tax=Streptomyces curacoi TaxID=146536 RepID=A0A124H729_9ACTN|nr:hypothetical protein [Streptomyces curacoi]KUM81017.1 hypothetical protein AQI70_03220 [Streptomyces curacoi]